MKPAKDMPRNFGQLRQLHGKKKAQYIWDYYKFPIVVCLIFLYIIGYMVYGRFTKKEPVLYVGLINIAAGEQLTSQLDDEFWEFAGETPSGSSRGDFLSPLTPPVRAVRHTAVQHNFKA